MSRLLVERLHSCSMQSFVLGSEAWAGKVAGTWGMGVCPQFLLSLEPQWYSVSGIRCSWDSKTVLSAAPRCCSAVGQEIGLLCLVYFAPGYQGHVVKYSLLLCSRPRD